MCFFTGSVNSPDVNHFFLSRVRKAAPRKSKYSKRDQYYPKRLIHGILIQR